MLLRNQEMFRDALRIDIARDVRERLRMECDDNESCDGLFFEHDGEVFGMGTEAGTIYVILTGQLLKYDDAIETRLEESSEWNIFTAFRDSRELCHVVYTPQKASGCVSNEDDECVDGFLWMHNVLRSPERRAIMIANKENDG